jgi:Glycosyltransferase family 87
MKSGLFRIGPAVAMFELGVFVAAYLIFWIVARPGDSDFGAQYSAAFVGIHAGWSHIYDARFLQPVEAANHLDGFSLFQHPAPVAWLAVPLTVLPFRWAALVWQSLLLTALIFAALLISPARRWDRALTLLSVAGFQPVLFALGYGTMSPLVLLLFAGALRALEGEAPVVAGVLLGLTALKPQLTLLVVPVMLAAGYRKTALTTIGVVVALAVASVAVVGASGTRDLISFVSSPYPLTQQQMPWTLTGLLGGVGLIYLVATVVVVVATAAVANRLRMPADVALALGILASLFVSPHLTQGDFVVWLLPVWLAFRAGRPWWLGAIAALTWVTGWFVQGIPVVSLTGEVALAVAFVVAGARGSPARAPAAAVELAVPK